MWSSHPSHPFSTVVDVLWTSLDQEAGLGLSEAQRLWDECAGLLRAQASEPVWLTQFDDARAVALPDDTLTVAVTSFLDRKRVVSGNSVAVRVDLGARRIRKNKPQQSTHLYRTTPQ